MVSISIVVPAYNEEKAIKSTIGDIKKSVRGLKHKINILVVDDGSTDRTYKIISSIKGINVIRHDTNKGYGASLKTAIKSTDSEYIMIIDADGTYPSSSIPALIKNLNRYDMIVGARTGKVVKIPFFRKPAKWLLKQFAQYITKTHIPDLNSGLRIFKRSIALQFMNLFPDGFSFTTTLTIACIVNGYSIKYMPINYYERVGISTIHPIKDFVNFMNIILRLAIFFKPLNVFIPASLVLFVLGVLKLIRDFLLLNYFGLGGALLILTSIQIAFLGVLAELIIKRTSI
ncbi:MAG: glycosyltransferase family 2 protein [Nanoarchaeota archaeon]|nr:glycosyltransferase family 2 protein [Nanoarchaeota archaeon]